MKKFNRVFLFALLLSLLLSLTAYADDSAAQLNYVTDEAGLLNMQEYSILNTAAAQISAEYGCSVYIITVNDYRNYTNGDIDDCATQIFNAYELGYGEDKNGVLLILSMDDRDYSLIAHGAVANAAFTDYAKDVMRDGFLDNFSGNDWFGGFEDYIDCAERMLAEAAKGTPVDVSPVQPATRGSNPFSFLLVVFVPCLIALVICSSFKAQMKTARIKTSAGDYVENGGINLHVRQDMFMHRTQTRQIIQQQQNRSVGSVGGGTTIRTGGFSGKSGKF